MLQTIFQLGRNTFRDSLRQPIYIILLLSGLGVIGLYPTMSVWFSFRGQEKLVVDGSLATILLLGWVTAVLCASHTISREIESGTILLILSKPVSRPVFVIAKLLGVLSALFLYVWVLSLASMMALRMATDQFRFDPYIGIALLASVIFACLYGAIRNYFGATMSGLAAVLITMATVAGVSGICIVIGMAYSADKTLLPPMLMLVLVGIIVVIVYTVLRKKTGRAPAGHSFSEETVKCLVVILSLVAVGVYFLPPWKSISYDWQAGFGGYNWRLVRELVLIMFAVLAMGTLATALSTRLNLMSNLIVCGAMFMLGLMSNYLYKQMLALKLENLEQMMHSWFYALVPFLVFLWVLTAKHYHNRRQKKIGRVQLHASFAVILTAIVAKAIYNHQQQIYLNTPAAWMRVLALGLYSVKNFAAKVFYAVIPNWQNFWLADVVTKPDAEPIPFEYIGFSGFYILLIITLFTTLALILFQDREVGTQTLT